MTPPNRASLAMVTTAAACALAVLMPDPSSSPSLAEVLEDVAGTEATRLPRLAPAAEHVEMFERRVAAHPRSANSHYMLATLQARQARESGDESLYTEAERVLRRALVLRPDYAEAELALAQALSSQHRFAESASIARSLIERWPESSGAAATLVDALTGSGDYDEAARLVDELAVAHAGPAVMARQAAIAELHGRDAEALDLLLRAARSAKARYVARSEMAWYLFRLSEFHALRGRNRQALAAAGAALRLEPTHLGSQVARARLLAASGALAEAIEGYESIVSRVPHPEHLATLADLYRGQRRDREAEASLAAALQAGRVGGSAEDRPMARLLADRRLSPSEAVHRARRDLETRRDVEAYDTLAWALFAAGDIGEAAEAITTALRFGTRRADFHLHAAAIAEVRGRQADASRHREAAHEINPHARLRAAAPAEISG